VRKDKKREKEEVKNKAKRRVKQNMKNAKAKMTEDNRIKTWRILERRRRRKR
jgi:hypothetical protein